MLPFDTDTISSPLTSREPPNCGVVSSTTLAIDEPDTARPDTMVLRVIFLRPPPDVSTARNTSSLATVLISDKSPTAVGLKFVPSAMRRCPEVLVPITRSSPLIVRSPPTTTSPLNVALPARAISISRAVIALEPSVPLIVKFLSAVLTVNTASPESCLNSSIDVPEDLKNTSLPAASSMMSPPESSVISVPSLVIVSRAILPTFVISASPKDVAPSVVDPLTVKSPPTVKLALMSTPLLALMSTVGAVISSSVSALISS